MRAAIAAAASGDVIRFDPSLNGQDIVLASELSVTRELGIEGPGADKIAISGGNRTRIFFATAPLTLSGLTLKNGLGDGAALYVLRARATVISCSFTDNSAPDGVAARFIILFLPSRSPIANFRTIPPPVLGWAEVLYGSPRVTVTMTDCVFTENSADNGGAIYAGGPLTLLRCNFARNSIPTDGIAGAVFNEYLTTITGCTFTGNSTGDGGAGGALFLYSTDGIIRDSLFANNRVGSGYGAQGGGIWNDGTLRIENSTIANNMSGAQSTGAGIYNDGVLILDNATVSGNSTGESSQGGGIFNEDFDGASVSAANTIIARNSAPTGPDISGTFISRGYNLIGNIAGNTGATLNDLIQHRSAARPAAGQWRIEHDDGASARAVRRLTTVIRPSFPAPSLRR